MAPMVTHLGRRAGLLNQSLQMTRLQLRQMKRINMKSIDLNLPQTMSCFENDKEILLTRVSTGAKRIQVGWLTNGQHHLETTIR